MNRFTLALLLVLVGVVPSRANIIVNGDFEAGNTGFTSSYLFGLTGPQASYDILTSPFPSHPSAADYPDHTPAPGVLMFVGNGATSANVVFWSQTLAIVPNTNYAFSMWMSSWVAANTSTFDIRFNGVSIGTPAAPTTVAVWQQFATNWNSGGATLLTINMIETRQADVGSDFAIDDIALVGPAATNTVPEPSSLLLAICVIGILGLLWLHRKSPFASQGC